MVSLLFAHITGHYVEVLTGHRIFVLSIIAMRKCCSYYKALQIGIAYLNPFVHPFIISPQVSRGLSLHCCTKMQVAPCIQQRQTQAQVKGLFPDRDSLPTLEGQAWEIMQQGPVGQWAVVVPNFSKLPRRQVQGPPI